MANSKRKAFTLIELIGVLVIMAILALIATPLVMNIIRKARIPADRRSIDAYGRSIELAIAGYLLDNGKFPTDISQLTIEYSGDEVVCETAQINPDSSVYLAGCKVKGRSVTNYTYGSDKSPSYKAYNIGDEVTYNNVNYYVIKDSGKNDSTVKLLKAEPLTVDEVNEFGTGHVNRYTFSSVGTAYNSNGYGGIVYYSSETCNSGNHGGCINDYKTSDIKYVVDAWKTAQAPAASEARLILQDEIEIESKEVKPCGSCEIEIRQLPKYEWIYNRNYTYWTNSLSGDSGIIVVEESGEFKNASVALINPVVRPVIVLDKSVLPNE